MLLTVVVAARQAVRSACSQMGARAFLDQLAVDTLQHRTHGVADEIDVCTLKDYMKVGRRSHFSCPVNVHRI